MDEEFKSAISSFSSCCRITLARTCLRLWELFDQVARELYIISKLHLQLAFLIHGYFDFIWNHKPLQSLSCLFKRLSKLCIRPCRQYSNSCLIKSGFKALQLFGNSDSRLWNRWLVVNSWWSFRLILWCVPRNITFVGCIPVLKGGIDVYPFWLRDLGCRQLKCVSDLSDIKFVQLLQLNEIYKCSVCVKLKSLCWLGKDCKVVCLKVDIVWTSDWPTFEFHFKVGLLPLRNKHHLHAFLSFKLYNFVLDLLCFKDSWAVVANIFFLISYGVIIWNFIDVKRKGLS